MDRHYRKKALQFLSDFDRGRRYTFKSMTSDWDLLEKFRRENSQDAFREIVRRHLDLVYSAALRQVRSPQLAEEIAQSVFADLARQAARLKPDTILTAWLYAVTRRTAVDAIRKESRRRLREQIAVEMNLMNATESSTGVPPAWSEIEIFLDDAMAALDETDRSAVLLRFFENKSLREVGEALGASEDAAQKRVSRAVDRLREFFSKRKVTVGASGLAVLISANAVQSAPVGLAATISAAALAGTAFSTSTAITATKVIAMTTLQKTLITATVAVLAGAGIYEARQALQLREQNQTLQQEQAPLAEQIRQLQRERDDATNRLANLLAENEQLKSNPNQTELLRLRGQVTTLQADATKLRTDAAQNATANDAFLDMAKSFATNDFMKTAVKNAMVTNVARIYAKFITDLHLTPEQASALQQLLINKMTAGMDMNAGVDMLSGKMDTAQLSQITERIKAEQADADNQIKALLGDAGFAQYQQYEKTIEDRSLINGTGGFAEELTGGTALTGDQTEQLIKAVSEERQNFKFSADFSDKSKSAASLASTSSEEFINQHLREQDRLNQLYLARAQTILSPDQLTAFQQFLSNRQQMQAMMLRMTAKMSRSKAGGN